MKLASIVPVSYMEHTCDADYAMLLAHLADYYPEEVIENSQCYKIMDNSLIECGQAMSIDDIIKAARRCRAQEVVLPDVFNDGPNTYRKAIDTLAYIKRIHALREFRWMAVCQGRDLEEFVECFELLSRIPEIHCIGIPKVTERFHPTLGRRLLENFWQGCSKAIHLLGVAKNLAELREYYNPAGIRSVDTCIPALLSKTTNYPWMDRPEKTIDLLNDTVNKFNYDNIIQSLQRERLI